MGMGGAGAAVEASGVEAWWAWMAEAPVLVVSEPASEEHPTIAEMAQAANTMLPAAVAIDGRGRAVARADGPGVDNMVGSSSWASRAGAF
jgi:hypothetical protein